MYYKAFLWKNNFIFSPRTYLKCDENSRIFKKNILKGTGIELRILTSSVGLDSTCAFSIDISLISPTPVTRNENLYFDLGE